jgi:hypothetical protein
MPYARARTLIGLIALLILALFCLSVTLPVVSTALTQISPQPAVALALLLGGWLLISLPLDWVGGYWLPARYARSQASAGQWMLNWAKASLTQTSFFYLNLLALSAMTNWLGFVGAIGWMCLSMVILLGFQFYLHVGITWAAHRLENDQGRLLFVVDHADRSFTGGIFGLPGKESIVYPRYWRDRFRAPVNRMLINRRHGAINTGAHGRGVMLAFGWNLLLFAGAMLLSRALPNTVVGLCQTIGWYSLLSLLSTIGLLPWLSRRGVYEVDRWTYFKGLDPDLLREGMAETHRLREDLDRSAFSRTFTHSVPTLAMREQHFVSQQPLRGAWQATRQAVFTSWAGGNLLCRSLPEQLGRPELWVFLPGD